MASKRPQTMAKRAREQAVKERRDLKRAKKREAAAARTAAREEATLGARGEDVPSPGAEDAKKHQPFVSDA